MEQQLPEEGMARDQDLTTEPQMENKNAGVDATMEDFARDLIPNNFVITFFYTKIAS